MQYKKPVLLIDQDDVLAEYVKGLTELYNKKYKTNFTVNDCTCWDIASVLGERVHEIMYESELFLNLEPVPKAIETFERLYKSGLFEMYIVTAAHPKSVEAKFQWLNKYMPFFPKSNVIVTSSKFMIKGDYLLDDGMHNIIEFLDAGGKAIVFERPHNQSERLGYVSVEGWEAFENLIMKECCSN